MWSPWLLVEGDLCVSRVGDLNISVILLFLLCVLYSLLTVWV